MGLLNFIRGNKKNPTIRTSSDVQQVPPQLPPINQPGSMPYLPNYFENQQPQQTNQQQEIQYPVLQQPNIDPQVNEMQLPVVPTLNPMQPTDPQPIQFNEPEDPMAGFMPSVQGLNNNVLPPVQPPAEMISQDEPVQEEVSQNEIAADYMSPQPETPIQETQAQPTVQPIRNFPIIPNIQDLKLPEIPGMQPKSTEPNQTNVSDTSQNDEMTTVSDISSNKSLDDLLKIDLPKLPDISGLVGTPIGSQNTQNSNSQAQVNLPTQSDATQESNSIVDLPQIPELPKLDLSLLQPMNFQANNNGANKPNDNQIQNQVDLEDQNNTSPDTTNLEQENKEAIDDVIQDQGIPSLNDTIDVSSNDLMNNQISDSNQVFSNDSTTSPSLQDESNLINNIENSDNTHNENNIDIADITNSADISNSTDNTIVEENASAVENQTEVLDENFGLQTNIPSSSEPTNTVQEDIANNIDSTNLVSTQPEMSIEENEKMSEPIELTTNLVSASEKQSEEVETAPNAISEKRIIKSVAFLGLDNGPMQQSTGNALVSVVKGLLKNSYEIVIDSKKGYGEHISQTAASIKKGVKGIFLKPYLSSDFSLPTKQLAESFNTSEIYSDYIERVKSIFRNSQAFIFLETGGIYNVSLLTTIWAVSKMYLGQNKPVILVGSFWKEKIESFKSLFDLSKNDLESIHILDSANEILSKLGEIEQSYKKRDDLMHVEKTLDMRIEGDESDYIVLP